MPRAKTKQAGFEYGAQKKKASARQFGGKTHLLEPLYDTHPTIIIRPKPDRQKSIRRLTASSAKAETAAPAYQKPEIPAQVISPDMVQTEKMVERQRLEQEFEQGPILMQRLEEYQGAAGIRSVMPAKRKLSRIEAFFKSLSLFVQRLIALVGHRRGRQLTMRGKYALAKLEELYALLSAAPDDNMDFVALRVAFGQAYFAVSQASEQHYKRHRGKGNEDYAAQFEGFLRELP